MRQDRELRQVPDAKIILCPPSERAVSNRSRSLAQADPELWTAIAAENRRQEDHIELIASENYASEAVMEAQGSQLTN